MQIFLDSANEQEIEKWHNQGVIEQTRQFFLTVSCPTSPIELPACGEPGVKASQLFARLGANRSGNCAARGRALKQR